MNKNQDKINYDSAGNFEFKGLQCSIAGRSVGAFFSRDTDYSVRYVSDTPRNVANTPDAFEQASAMSDKIWNSLGVSATVSPST